MEQMYDDISQVMFDDHPNFSFCQPQIFFRWDC